MTQNADPKPGRNDRQVSGLSIGSAEDYPVSPGFMWQIADLNSSEPPAPPRTPSNSCSRSCAARDSVQTPRRHMSRGVRLTPKACDSMHKASQSRALQMGDEETEMDRSSSPMPNGRMAEDGPTPQTDEVDVNVSTPAAYSDLHQSLEDFMVPDGHISDASTRLSLHPPTSPAPGAFQHALSKC